MPKSGRAEKGSRRLIQDYVNLNPDNLATMIVASSPTLAAFAPASIQWKSPLANDPSGEEYYEYRDDYLETLGLQQHKGAMAEFWPKNGPQWDALAVVRNAAQTGSILVEAKAHPAETFSDMKAKAPESVRLIRSSLDATQTFMNASQSDWTTKHYQLANRLAHLYFLNHIARVPTWLVLLNFLDDRTHKPTSFKDWVAAQTALFTEMGISHNSPLLDHVVPVFAPPLL